MLPLVVIIQQYRVLFPESYQFSPFISDCVFKMQAEAQSKVSSTYRLTLEAEVHFILMMQIRDTAYLVEEKLGMLLPSYILVLMFVK